MRQCAQHKRRKQTEKIIKNSNNRNYEENTIIKGKWKNFLKILMKNKILKNLEKNLLFFSEN